MYRKKDFILKDVISIDGTKLGYIKDLLIDFNSKKLMGFVVAPYKFFANKLYIYKDDILYYNKSIIVNKFNKKRRIDGLLSLNSISGMEVLDYEGELIGITEDIFFSESSFYIRGIILSTGFVRDFTKGKKIILIDKVIFGEEHLLYSSDKGIYDFHSKIQNSHMEEVE